MRVITSSHLDQWMRFNFCPTWFYFISVPISIAVAVEDYESKDENYISFKKGDKLTIFSKYVEADNSIWKGSLV